MVSATSYALAEGQGAMQNGMSVQIGYDGASLSYKETDPINSSVLDKDTGWQNGINAEARYDGSIIGIPFFMRGYYDFIGSGSAKYSGSLQNGTPITMSTKEAISKTEFDLGLKVWNDRNGTLSFYGGIGYRWWDRGQDALPDYKEKYRWAFGTAGANVSWRITDKFIAALDGALLIPISPTMKTNVAGLLDNATFHMKSRIGFRAQLPLSYDFYTIKRFKMYAYVTPYYERWNIGQSPQILLTSGGQPVAYAIEPKSHTDLFGSLLGVGVHF